MATPCSRSLLRQHRSTSTHASSHHPATGRTSLKVACNQPKCMSEILRKHALQTSSWYQGSKVSPIRPDMHTPRPFISQGHNHSHDIITRYSLNPTILLTMTAVLSAASSFWFKMHVPRCTLYRELGALCSSLPDFPCPFW
jgi:hypothetical protein